MQGIYTVFTNAGWFGKALWRMGRRRTHAGKAELAPPLARRRAFFTLLPLRPLRPLREALLSLLGPPGADLVIEDAVEDKEEPEGGDDEDAGIEPKDADAESEVFFDGTEEDVQMLAAGDVVAIVALFHLGFGDKVGDLLVDVELLRGDAIGRAAEFSAVEGGSSDDAINEGEAVVEFTRSFGPKPGEGGKEVLEILEAIALGVGRIFHCRESQDLMLDLGLAAGEGIEFRLGVDNTFVGPSHGHELANERDLEVAAGFHGGAGVLARPLFDRIDEIEVAVHVFIFDEGSGEDELGNEDDGNDEDGGFRLIDEGRHHQPNGNSAHGGEKHGGEDDGKHTPDREKGVAHDRKQDALDDGKYRQGEGLGGDVVAEADVEIALSEEDGSIAGDVIDAIGQSEKHGHDEGKKEIDRDVKGGGEVVVVALGVPEDKADEESEHRRGEEGDEEVGPIAQFADEGALEENGKLAAFLAPAKRFLPACGDGQGGCGFAGRSDLMKILHEAVSLEFIPPVVGGIASGRDELAAIVFLKDEIAGKIA